jgi:glyoxylase-like metal-dependent hydrolase (beta-lactamase superfamily II)
MPISDAVDWALDLGGGTRVALIRAGTFRSDAGALFGPVPRILWNGLVTDEIDDEHRLLQALNCLLVETPGGRVLVETGIGERVTDKVREMRRYEGPAIVPALRDAGFDPETVDVVAMSHLHFDHAGGLLLADGSRAFPRATIVAQRAEWEIALGDNSRLVASYDQPEIQLVRDWGQRRADRRPLGRSSGDRRSRHGRRRPDTGVLRRPVHAAVGGQPALGDGIRRLPARLGRREGLAVRAGR